MRNLLRQPLTWMVLAECVVVAALILLVWSLVAAAATQHPGTAQVQAAESTSQGTANPSPDVSQVTRSTARPQLPGLNLDAGFWRLRLGQLNREQVSFEQLEWHIVHGAMVTAQNYLETVVLPSIARAERAGGG
ncbi:MAG TPA: hypothetical protein VN940_08165 [Candidatus Dormibacteraeota bacterium]|nr:hypothetical protein [Candidatus Dormibacteraeota bacterium]